MMIDRQAFPAPLAAGGRLPSRRLPRLGTGETVEVRGDRRNPSMLFFAHSPECAGCRAYIQGLLERPDAFGVWGGRLLVILPGTPADGEYPATADFPVYVLVDDEGALARECGVEGARLLVADAWGEIHYTASAGAGHDLPSAEEIEEWLKFLAIQCPECEQPEGLWRSL